MIGRMLAFLSFLDIYMGLKASSFHKSGCAVSQLHTLTPERGAPSAIQGDS